MKKLWVNKTLQKAKLLRDPSEPDDWDKERTARQRRLMEARKRIREERHARELQQWIENFWRNALPRPIIHTGFEFPARYRIGDRMCPICDHKTDIKTEYIDEEEIHWSICNGCGLYHYRTGGAEKGFDQIGFVKMELERPWDQAKYLKRVQLRKQVIEETRRMYKNQECEGFFKNMAENPFDDGPKQVFLDWLFEHNGLYPLNQKALQEMYGL